jgi:hypothetical protein
MHGLIKKFGETYLSINGYYITEISLTTCCHLFFSHCKPTNPTKTPQARIIGILNNDKSYVCLQR